MLKQSKIVKYEIRLTNDNHVNKMSASDSPYT